MFGLKNYIPKSFCREFVEIKGNALQIGMYMALVLGFKPLMDDWIPIEKLEEFKKICKGYKLYVREDAVFLNVNKEDIPKNIVGRECLTTTSAYGLPLNKAGSGQVHLFLSRKINLLKKGMWYPLIIKDRVIFQPKADLLNYGYVLGYPECCIRFFRRFNDWIRYSHLYEIYKNTKGRPSFLCNPFLKDTPYSYIYHMPCSYNCVKTINLVKGLRKEIQKREPHFVRLTDQYLKMPFLVFYERKFYYFKGATLKNNFLKYKRVYFAGMDDTKDVYGQDLKRTDTLQLNGRILTLFRKKRLVKKIVVPLTNFAPEYPFLIQFS